MNRANPLIQALSLIVAAAFLGLAFVIGAVLISLLLALGAVAALAVAIRIWWLHRKARAAAVRDPSRPTARRVLEAEYTIVETDAKAGGPRSGSRDDALSRPRDPEP